MEALQFDAQTKILALTQTEIPKIKNDNEVLVKVAYSGVCGTDLHILQGEFPCNQNGPFTPGHEFCGQIVAVGDRVKTVKVSDRVVVDPNSGCHVCRFCHEGNPHFCKDGGINFTLGIFRNGGWANYCVVPDSQVQKMPDSLTYEQGALCEPLSCIAHGWDIIAPITLGQKILIMGAGIIGNLWVINLHCQGHKNVTVSEPNTTRLNQIKKLNTGYELISPAELKARSQKDKNYLFDLIIDCSGYGPAIEEGIKLLEFGGKFCIFGVAPPTTTVSVSPFDIYAKELKIFGVNINPFTFPKAIGLLESLGTRYLTYENLGIRVYKLSEYKQALEDLKKGQIAKGEFPCNQNGPFTPGHEFCGQIVAVGDRVKTVKVSDRVVVDPNSGCHVCRFCHEGNPHFCKDGGINFTLGIFRNGGWANYCVVPDSQVQKMPDSLTYEQGALCEPLSCIAHGWDIIAPITLGQKILIMGAGIIGNLWVINLHCQGHKNVTVSEPNTTRLNQIKKLNTGYELISPAELKARSQKDKNYLFDLIIDCSGYGPAIEEGIKLLEFGGKFCIFGVAPPTTTVSVSPFDIYAKELKIFGVNINPFTFPKAIGLLESLGTRYLTYENLGIRVYKLSEYKQALEDLKKGQIAKVVFKL